MDRIRAQVGKGMKKDKGKVKDKDKFTFKCKEKEEKGQEYKDEQLFLATELNQF